MKNVKSLDKGLGEILNQGKVDTEKTTKEFDREIKKRDKEKKREQKEIKHQSYMVYLSKKNENRFSQAILTEKMKSEKKSDVSKTSITEKLILEWMDKKGY
jgi:hypothetical protein